MPKSRRLHGPAVCATTLVACLLSGDAPSAEPETRVAVVADGAQPGEMLVARELESFLAKLYPEAEFRVSAAPSAKDVTHVIVVGTKATRSQLLGDEERNKLKTPGSFVVFTRPWEGKPTGFVVGSDRQGLWCGV